MQQEIKAPIAELPARLTPRACIVTAKHGDDTVLLDVISENYYSLNATGSRIWQWLCDDVAPADLAHRLQETFGVSEDRARVDVLRLLQQCAESSLFEEPWCR